MNTLHLKYAVEVERTRSITKAADNMFMAQPNLSKAIKELEDTLGIIIFERTSKGVIPTQKGAEFLSYAKQVLKQISKMESLNSVERKKTQTLEICFVGINYVSESIIELINEFSDEKAIDFTVREMNSLGVINAIDSGISSMGVIHIDNDNEQYFIDFLKEKRMSYELIWEYNSVILASESSNLFENENIDCVNLNDNIEIIYEDSGVPYIQDKYSEERESLSKIIVTDQYHQFEVLSKNNRTFIRTAPVSEDILKRYKLKQQKSECLNNRYKDFLIYEEGYKFTEIEKQFFNKLYALKNNVIFALDS